MIKRFLAVLFALGLIVAVSRPAAAVDVKFSGYYSVWGFYTDNQSLGDEGAAGEDNESASHAFYAQRLRLNTIFQVTEGLRMTTACDIMEKVWGAHREKGGYEPGDVAHDTWDEENVDFDKLFVSFDVPFGTFHVGYQPENKWGTAFGNDIYTNLGKIKYAGSTGPWSYAAWITKGKEGDLGTVDWDEDSDADHDWYTVAASYKGTNWDAGLLYRYFNDKSETRGFDDTYDVQYHVLSPYARATFGPLYVEGQIYYAVGDDAVDFEHENGVEDTDVESLTAYIMAKVDLQPFYVGAQFAYAKGDDDPDDDEINDLLGTGSGYNPCLILGNWELNHWAGKTGNANGFGVGDQMHNVWFSQLFAGWTPTEKLHLKASVSYAEPDEKVDGNDDEYGTEFDITATYKIHDNLAYTVGFGYLCAGDYFEGPDDNRGKVDDNYLVMNNLKLTF
jgi:hypothetical protein